MFGFSLLAILVLLIVALVPVWPYSARWGITPAMVVLVLLIVWILVLMFGWVAFTWPWAVGR